jgi:hypothetical protein
LKGGITPGGGFKEAFLVRISILKLKGGFEYEKS